MSILFSTLRFKNWGYISNVHTPSSCIAKGFEAWKGIPQARQHRVVSALHSMMTWIFGTGSSAVKTRNGTLPTQ